MISAKEAKERSEKNRNNFESILMQQISRKVDFMVSKGCNSVTLTEDEYKTCKEALASLGYHLKVSYGDCRDPYTEYTMSW